MWVRGTLISLFRGDIIEQDTDVIVNAANSSLMGGGGVDGAIHKAGGPRILEECRKIRETMYPGGMPTGEAVLTTGGNLRAKYVIHTVGPIWKDGNNNEPDLLAKAYINSLYLAMIKGFSTISFPSISTGAFGYPIELAAKIALKSVIGFIEKNDWFTEIIFVLFSQRDLEVYNEALKKVMT